MENNFAENSNQQDSTGLNQTVTEYLSLKIDQCKLRGVNGLTLLSNKMIFLLLVTMLGGVILQLIGLSFAFFISEIVGSQSLGFLIVALFFLIILFILYLVRKKLFINRLVKLYIDLFFKD